VKASRSAVSLGLVLAIAGCDLPPGEQPGSSRVYDCTIDQAWRAVERAALDLGFRSDEDLHDEQGGMLWARGAEGSELAVRAAPFEEGTTLVSVAAPNHDRAAEEAFLARVDSHVREPVATEHR
jgi:hypothetical protein